MKVTLAQISPKLNRSNLEFVIELVQKYQSETDLLIFPELSLNGYLLQDKLFEDAWKIEELEELSTLSKNVDIVVGAAIREESYFKNAALYFSSGSLLSKHDKVYLPNYGMFEEARYFKAGNKFESFISKYGKISMLVCEDMWHKNVHKDLIHENPDLIIVLVASPARGFTDNGLVIEKKWNDIISQVASECNAKLLFVNRVGFEDGLGFWGGSCTVDCKGLITNSLGLYKTEIQTFEI